MLLVLAPLWFAAISIAALLLGCRILSRLGLADHRAPAFLGYGLATGYLILGLTVAGVGLAGFLTRPVVLGLLTVALLVGAYGSRNVWDCTALGARGIVSLVGGAGRVWAWLSAAVSVTLVFSAAMVGTGALGSTPLLVAAFCVAALTAMALWRPGFGAFWLLAAWCLVTFLATLAPPADMDWDGLAEHLAQAKIYATSGRYQPLWYDHHSQFPALTQMLFTVGMLFQGPELAKLFHWAFGLLGLLSCWWLGCRVGGPAAGRWAALTYASTPIIGWLMQVGYVDLSTTAYGLLAVLAFLEWRENGLTGRLSLSAVMVGAAMGTKMQGLSLFGVLLIATVLFTQRARTPVSHAPAGTDESGTEPCSRYPSPRRWWACRASYVARFAIIALVVGGGWYVKSYVLTGNPVYPFAYGLFGGKYWGPEEARAYSYHQKAFGVGHLPPPQEYWSLTGTQRLFLGPRSPLNLLLAPWNLTFNPIPFTDYASGGKGALYTVIFTNWIGPMYFLGLTVMAGIWVRQRITGRREGQTGHADSITLLGLFAPQWLWWLISMQYTRYLVPSLVLLAPVVGRAWHLLPTRVSSVISVLWMGAALAMVTYVASPALTVPTGLLPRDTYARTACTVYAPSQVLNRVVPPHGKVILFGEPRGFYIDREYLWGDPGHHRLIPYEQLRTPQALLSHFRNMGITHVLVNLAQTGPLGPHQGSPLNLLGQAVAQGLVRRVEADDLSDTRFLILDLRPGKSEHVEQQQAGGQFKR